MVNPQPGVNTIDVQATLLHHDARLTRVEEAVSALSGLPEAVAKLTIAVDNVSVAVSACLNDLRDFRHETAENFKAVYVRMDAADVRMDAMDVRMDKMDTRFDLVDVRLNKIDTRLDKIDTRLDKIDTRLDKMDVRLDKMDARMDRMDARFDGIDGRLDRMEGLLVRIADKLEVARPADPTLN